jgi:hypothetical protein
MATHFDERIADSIQDDWATSGVDADFSGIDALHGNFALIGRAAASIDADTFEALVDEMFVRQKDVSAYLGVGESTVAGWVKAGTYPPYARTAILAAYLDRRAQARFEDMRRRSTDPRPVRDGDGWIIVSGSDGETGVPRVLARGIPDARTARILASAPEAWRLLSEVDGLMEHWVDTHDPDWVSDLRHRCLDARRRAVMDPAELAALRTREAEAGDAAAAAARESRVREVEEVAAILRGGEVTDGGSDAEA